MLLCILTTYAPGEVIKVIEPGELLPLLLDEIKLKRPSASVKGTIWTMVGQLHSKYAEETDEFAEESQDVMFSLLKEQMTSKKPELKHIQGLFKGLSNCLENCKLEPDQLKGLFRYVTVAMDPQFGGYAYGVMKTSMKLLLHNVALFRDLITQSAIECVNRTLSTYFLCVT